ncbi:MAG: bifunctional UDP-N-acetylglucosamine diphosphorylase/glucosamine-1-phosphate N-acetyltransferase GlmU [Hyphomonadaceae bacterium]|nr:bifunctional UDP-N-acetylglucosamine diphosphorylase/glucosamine-1-phosphate N-acetyltransferase GlmU [Hyphomonadaceae bacterium]
MSPQRAAIILAAGRNRRMKSSRSKVLHEVGGRTMLAWVGDLVRRSGMDRPVCVVGEADTDVRTAAQNLDMDIAVQELQSGTGHAVNVCRDMFEGFDGTVTVLYADTPLIRKDTLSRVFEAHDTGADTVVLGFETDEPGAYGRLVTDNEDLSAIVEAKEATPEQLAITLCNSGVLSCNSQSLFSALSRVTNNNAKGEYYLTDIVGILRGDGKTARVVRSPESEVLGVNSRHDLAKAEAAFQDRKRMECLDRGVTLRDPDSVIFAYDTDIARDVEIGANVVFGPGVSIATGTVIRSFCHVEGAIIGENVTIGPFARVRPGTHLGEGVQLGNFIETKKAAIGRHSKVSHLSYIGDAEVGENVNIGAGTVTCNYDGYFKHKTIIGNGAFVGTHSSLVAPVTIGHGAFLGSGGVITDNVPDDALALGRARQVNREGWARRYHMIMSRRKEQKT